MILQSEHGEIETSIHKGSYQEEFCLYNQSIVTPNKYPVTHQ